MSTDPAQTTELVAYIGRYIGVPSDIEYVLGYTDHTVTDEYREPDDLEDVQVVRTWRAR